MPDSTNPIKSNYEALFNYTNTSDKYELRVVRSIWGIGLIAIPKDQQQKGLFGLISSIKQKIFYYDKTQTLHLLADMEASLWTPDHSKTTRKMMPLMQVLLMEKGGLEKSFLSLKDLTHTAIRKLEIEKIIDQMSPVKAANRKQMINILEQDPKLYKNMSSLMERVNKFKGTKPISKEIKSDILALEKTIALHMTQMYPDQNDSKDLDVDTQKSHMLTRELFRHLSSQLVTSAVETSFALLKTVNEINLMIGMDNAFNQKGFNSLLKVVEASDNPSEVVSLLKNMAWLSEAMRNKTLDAVEHNRFPDIDNEIILWSELAANLALETNNHDDLSLPFAMETSKSLNVLQLLQQASSSAQNTQAHTDSIMPSFLITEKDKENLPPTTERKNDSVKTEWKMDEDVRSFKKPFIADRIVIFKSPKGTSFEARCQLDLSPLGNLTKEDLKEIFRAYSLSIGRNGFDTNLFKNHLIMNSENSKVKDLLLTPNFVAIISDFDKEMTLEFTRAKLRIGDKKVEERYQKGKTELLPLTYDLVGPHFKIDSQTENTLLRFLSEDSKFFNLYKTYLSDVKKARQETLDQLKQGIFSKTKLTALQVNVHRGPTSPLAMHLSTTFDLSREDPKIVRLVQFFSILRDTAVVGNTQMNTDCLIPIELVSKDDTSTRGRTINRLNRDGNFSLLSQSSIASYPHWENTTKLDGLKEDSNKTITFKGDRVITFKAPDGSMTEARIPLDLSALGELNLKSLDQIFQWLEMNENSFHDEMQSIGLYQSLGNEKTFSKKTTILEKFSKFDTEQMTKIYNNFIEESEQRIASALINLSLDPIDKRVDSFQDTLKKSMDSLNNLPELSGIQMDLDDDEIKNFSKKLTEALKTNPDCINDFNAVIKSACNLSTKLSELPPKDHVDFQTDLKKEAKTQLSNLQSSIKDGTILKNLKDVETSLTILQKSVPIAENDLKQILIDSNSTFSDTTISHLSITKDWMRDLHHFSLKGSNKELKQLGNLNETLGIRSRNILQSFELIAQEDGEWDDDFEEIINYAKEAVASAENDPEKLAIIIKATLDSLENKKNNCKTIKAIRAMTQGNQVPLTFAQSFLSQFDYKPLGQTTVPVRQTLSFEGDTIILTGTADCTLESSKNSKDQLNFKGTLVHEYDKDMTYCMESKLTISDVDVKKMPSDLQKITELMLNVDIKVTIDF
jgi:hypothetical protein